jgi:SAM-dependent methyltransferase
MLLQSDEGTRPMTTSEFDAYAEGYSNELNRVLAVTGESVEDYAEQRIALLALRLKQRGVRADSVLDFGCGTRTATPYVIKPLVARPVLGIDVSPESLRFATLKYAGLPASFIELEKYEPEGNFDLAFCNGVFHHILPASRIDSLRIAHASLRPEGIFAFWENNPWNPETRWLMSRKPIDRDAITISPDAAERLLSSAGFRVFMPESLFYFPRSLAWFRPLESPLGRLPLGGQYVILCVKKD